MKKSFPFFLFFLFVFSSWKEVDAQQQTDIQNNGQVALTPQQLYSLSAIPPLILPERYKGPDAPLIPYWIDNSTQPYFRPITSQSGLECGQSAGIAFNFTYEIDRLRNLPANVTANQYPTHFAWNFINGGTGSGASCFDSWEIVRACGTMNVVDYGGTLGFGGSLRWITGYDKYYNGMQNRINYMRSIRCDTPEGLQTLKYWLFDHLEGSSVGGVANFYGNYFGPSNVLPPGTPEAGKCVQTSWGASPSHTWTVCGYNDSIRWDYNGDGQYTNNTDINGDGNVDMHDWEIGGLKFANGYAGTGWGNQGFCYQMYKCLADAIGYGGIWNHSVYVIDTKQNYTPNLTAKITLKHNSRNKIKVTMGVSTDLAATTPSYVLEFPIFKYQGGDYYMQGGSTEADKTIEFGLDLAPLVNQLNNGQEAKFFLQVQENDPSGTGTGDIISYDLVDYTSGTPVTISCPTTNIPIANNTITRLGIIHAFTVNRPEITTASIPPAFLYQPFSYQLTAANGVVPYLWDAVLNYPETTSSATFPNVTNQQLTLTDNNSGYALLDLPFDFPFYKRSINKLHIYADGYILFDDQPFTWPYLIDKMLLFRYTSIISPFMTDLNLYPAQSNGIWYQYDGNAVTIRWKASIYSMPTSSNLNFAVKLYKDGKIEFYYGTMNYPVSTSWTGGICSGDNKNYQFSLLNGAPTITTNTLDQMAACGFPAEMQITEDGLFTGVPVHSYQDRPVNFQVTDNNNISCTKTLLFSTAGILINYTINSGGDSIIEFGETTYLNLDLTNTGPQTIHNVNISVTESDPYISLIDSTQVVGDISGTQNLNINNAFELQVSPLVPNNHQFTLLLHLSSTEQNVQRSLDLVAWAPNINVTGITLQDGDNGDLDPGETTNMLVSFKNEGGAKANNVVATISSIDPYLTINSGTGNLGTLKPDSTKSVIFNVSVSGDAPFQHLYIMNSELTANNGYSHNDSIFLFSGEIIEDFETGNYNKFPWYLGGNGLFYVDELEHYEGNYCSRSGWIYDNQESTLNLNVQVLQYGEISFYRKVSCEDDLGGNNYDYLGFYIDNVEMGRWDGFLDWAKVAFNVTPGYHTLKWVYHKDYSVSSGSDCAWVDFITFPPIAGAYPLISATPATFEKSLDMGQTSDDSLFVSNNGGGILDFFASVFDTTVNKGSGETDNLSGSFLSCNTDGFVPGQNFAWTFTVHNNSLDNEYINHVKMDFPPGILINAATNYSGGSLGDLQFLGTTGNGATLNWHGTSTGVRGVIKPGETATAIISGTVNESFYTDAFVVYSIRGDSIGVGPHATSGYVKLRNFSLPNTWLALSHNFGTLFGGQSDTVMVQFDARDLPANDYSCSIIVKDLFNNVVVIPVLMHVMDTTTISRIYDPENKWVTSCYPNPFRNFTRIDYGIRCQTDLKAEVYDINGHKIKTLVNKIHQAGNYNLTWDGTNNSGDPVSSGVYYCRCQSGEKTETIKMILMR